MFLSHSVLKSKITWAAGLMAAFVAFSSSSGLAYDGRPAPKVADEKPAELEGVGIVEQLGAQIDLSTLVTDDNGQEVPLKSFFDGKHPLIISPVYFSCPGLCNFHLNGLTEALKELGPEWSVGNKFKILAFSFDSKETPDLAANKKKTYIKLYERADSETGWHFLTAKEDVVQSLSKALGFGFKWDEKSKEWAHASAAIIITPDGKISRYLPGIMFNAKDVKMALNEAADGKIGTFVEELMLFCFKYDPQQSKYALVAFNVMKVGGAITVLLMGLWLLLVYIRSRKKNKSAGR